MKTHGIRAIAIGAWLLISATTAAAQRDTASAVRAQHISADERAAKRAAETAHAVARARTLISAGDSIQAAELLRTATERDQANGPLWHEYGMLLSAMNKGALRNRETVWPAGMAERAKAAEDALALGSELAPDSVQYTLDYAQYLWNARFTNADHAIDIFRTAVLRLANSTDSVQVSETSDFLAHQLWRRFDRYIGLTAFRHNEDIGDFLADNGPGKAQTSFAGTNAGWVPPTAANPGIEPPIFLTTAGMQLYINQTYPQPKVMLGAAQFPEIVRFAKLARTLNPDAETYFRHEAQIYAGMKQWDELATLARARIAERPTQPWPWLTLGLSEYNLHRVSGAMSAFDSGFARLANDDRERLSSIKRLTQAPQAAIYDTLSPLGRRQFRQFYFNTANPSLLLGFNPIMAEFRARAVYAELQFTEEVNHQQGTDTDAGDTWIRYGPPDVSVMRRHPIPANGAPPAGPPLNIWFYLPPHFSVTFFTGSVTGSKSFTPHTRAVLDQFTPAFPSLWVNVPIVKKGIDALSAQVARFRAGNDSVDIAAFSGINIGILRRDAPAATSTIKHGLFVLDEMGAPLLKAVATDTSSERNKSALMAEAYRVRAPTRARGVRLEALEPDLEQAAQAITEFTPTSSRGFGVSDLLVAATAEPATSGARDRWSTFNFTPLAGSLVLKGGAVSLLWESYEPQAVNGTMKLRFAITVERETSKGFVATTVRTIGGLANAVTGRAPNANQFTIGFEREAAAARVQVDHLRLDLANLPTGRYRTQVTVTDLNSGQQATAQQTIEIIK